MPEPKLKPCPFCGEIPKITVYQSGISSPKGFHIKHCCGNGIWLQTAMYISEQLTIAAWNKRTEESE